MDDIMKTVKFLRESALLIKGVSETIENEAEKQKRWISQYVIRYITSNGVIRAVDEARATIR